jgi:hypothetical protein
MHDGVLVPEPSALVSQRSSFAVVVSWQRRGVSRPACPTTSRALALSRVVFVDVVPVGILRVLPLVLLMMLMMLMMPLTSCCLVLKLGLAPGALRLHAGAPAERRADHVCCFRGLQLHGGGPPVMMVVVVLVVVVVVVVVVIVARLAVVPVMRQRAGATNWCEPGAAMLSPHYASSV